MTRPTPPDWAKAAIVAQLYSSDCDIMTDYWGAHVEGAAVVLAWSKHTRDLFSEMRKAAATFPPTAHMGPGLDLWTVRVVFANDVPDDGMGRMLHAGDWAHTHDDLTRDKHGDHRTFGTEADARAWATATGWPHPVWYGEHEARFEWQFTCQSYEQRQKWSMGHGYFLGVDRYHGWQVSKTSLRNIESCEAGPALTGPVGAPWELPTDGAPVVRPGRAGNVEVVFPAKPSADIREALKAAGFRWAVRSACWYGPASSLPAGLAEAQP